MIAAIKKALRRWVLTEAERVLLGDAPRATWRRRFLKTFLNADQLAVVEMMERLERVQPEVPLTHDDAANWGAALRSPLGAKIDVLVCNMCAEQAQQAIHQVSSEMVRSGGFAAGFRACWAFVRGLSTTAGSEPGKLEGDADTGAHSLGHLNP